MENFPKMETYIDTGYFNEQVEYMNTILIYHFSRSELKYKILS